MKTRDEVLHEGVTEGSNMYWLMLQVLLDIRDLLRGKDNEPQVRVTSSEGAPEPKTMPAEKVVLTEDERNAVFYEMDARKRRIPKEIQLKTERAVLLKVAEMCKEYQRARMYGGGGANALIEFSEYLRLQAGQGT